MAVWFYPSCPSGVFIIHPTICTKYLWNCCHRIQDLFWIVQTQLTNQNHAANGIPHSIHQISFQLNCISIKIRRDSTGQTLYKKREKQFYMNEFYSISFKLYILCQRTGAPQKVSHFSLMYFDILRINKFYDSICSFYKVSGFIVKMLPISRMYFQQNGFFFFAQSKYNFRDFFLSPIWIVSQSIES